MSGPLKCRICDKPGELLPDKDVKAYVMRCGCRDKLPTTDAEIKAYAGAGFCDFACIDPVDEGDDGVPVCDIVPLKDGGVAWLRGGKIARFRSAADELVAREFLENAKKLES